MLLNYLFIGIFGYLTGAVVREPGIRYPPMKGSLWPKAKMQKIQNTYYIIKDKEFKFQKVSEHTCDILEEALKRYQNVIRGIAKTMGKYNQSVSTEGPLFEDYLKSLNVNLKQPCENFPSLYMDESYNITIAFRTANLDSYSIWGILRGLESFSQLISSTSDSLLRINSTIIFDAPRFTHRGLLVDTARHYITVSKILTILDGMAINKLNVFHWHIVDDESFPYESQVYPELSFQGSFRPNMIYSSADVNKIIQYARLLGIRVIVEFDTPGHTRSWGLSHPEFLIPCQGDLLGSYGPFDPFNEELYKFVEKLWEEIAVTFPDHYVHIGGDEVEFDCWKSNKNFTQIMKTLGFTKFEQLEEKYVQRVIDKFETLNKNTIVWHDVFDNGLGLPKETTVQISSTGDRLSIVDSITSRGHQVILSDCWYLDRVASGGDWEKFYNCDPYDFRGTDFQKALILGGEAVIMSEFVNDANIIQRIFPRACATAEKLWSVEKADVPLKAKFRLEEHACRMNLRGIQAGPPNGPGFCYL